MDAYSPFIALYRNFGNHEVQICASADGETCTPGASWDAGWVVLAKGRPFRTHAAVTQICQISATPAVTEAISFAADGRAIKARRGSASAP